MTTSPSRRALLRSAVLASVAGVVGGCGVEWSRVRLDNVSSPTPPSFTADDRARFAAISAITTLRLQTESLAGREPGDPGQLDLSSLADAHQRQLEALGPLPGPVPSASATPSDWPSAPPSTAAEVDRAALSQAEAAAATSLLTGVAELTGPMARLLTSIASSCAQAARRTSPDGQPPQLPAVPALPEGLTNPAPEELAGPVAATVAADEAAGFAYGPYAARLPGDLRGRAVSLMSLHTERALAVRALAQAAGIEVPPAPAAYDVGRPEDVAAACGDLEAACAQAGAALIGNGDAPARQLGEHVLRMAADAQQQWIGLVALPGLS